MEIQPNGQLANWRENMQSDKAKAKSAANSDG